MNAVENMIVVPMQSSECQKDLFDARQQQPSKKRKRDAIDYNEG